MKLIKISELKPIEGHSKKRVNWLKNKIIKEQIWTKPICIEQKYNIVLDGMHRFEVAKLLKMKYIPCELFDYNDVKVWSLRSNHIITASIVIEKIKQGYIYPFKTVKHDFLSIIKLCNIPLKELL
mgnify:CR=1 FL=1